LNDLENRSLRRVKQLGVKGVSIAGLDTGGLETWTDANLKRHIDRVADADLELRNIMFNPSDRVRFGEDGRDEDIETIIKAIQVAGRQGLPVMEYNFYAHRIVEGYKVVPGRGGSGLMDFNNDRIKDLPPLQGQTAHSLDDMWDKSPTSSKLSCQPLKKRTYGLRYTPTTHRRLSVVETGRS
jgi:mannonate dehydratase